MKEILWTVQHIEAYKAMKEKGVLRADEQFLFCRDETESAYGWMSEQMRRRIGAPPDNVKYPVWAWYQWEGRRDRRDLRFSGYAKRGTPMVQLKFEADVKEMLLSDFDDWHQVLNNCYLADNEQDFDDFYASDHTDRQREIEASWEKIFDLQRYCSGWDTPPERKSIQAVLWEINLLQVRKAELFIAK